jgi:hypothetical protein
VIKPEDRIAVIECRRRLNNKGFIELETLCSPLENNFLKTADHETYEVIGKLIHKKDWHQNGKKQMDILER